MAAIVPEAIPFPSALLRAQEGDHDAFARLVEEHEAMVYSIAWNFFGDRALAEEIAQDVFLQLYRNLGSIESDAHLLYWMRQVTTRRCIDQTRRTKIKRVSLDDAGEIGAIEHAADPILDRRVRQVVQELPELQRAIVTLRYQEDLGPAEICEIVGIPVNTVKSHLHRALQALRRKLENQT